MGQTNHRCRLDTVRMTFTKNQSEASTKYHFWHVPMRRITFLVLSCIQLYLCKLETFSENEIIPVQNNIPQIIYRIKLTVNILCENSIEGTSMCVRYNFIFTRLPGYYQQC